MRLAGIGASYFVCQHYYSSGPTSPPQYVSIGSKAVLFHVFEFLFFLLNAFEQCYGSVSDAMVGSTICNLSHSANGLLKIFESESKSKVFCQIWN